MPRIAAALSLSKPYTTLDEALSALTVVDQTLREQHDRRAIFTTAYLVITGAINQRIKDSWFIDNEWVGQYAVCFANLYRHALLAYESGDLALAKAWRFSFDTSAHNRGLLLQDLLLGVNAHINYDLALALHEVGIDPQRQERYRDHTAVNQVLQAATDRLQAQVCDLYAPILRVLDFAAGRWDEMLASFSVAKARENAWLTAVSLGNARDEQERNGLRAGLNDRAAVLSRLLLSPNPVNPLLITALRQVERFKPWWLYITMPVLEASAVPSPRATPA